MTQKIRFFGIFSHFVKCSHKKWPYLWLFALICLDWFSVVSHGLLYIWTELLSIFFSQSAHMRRKFWTGSGIFGPSPFLILKSSHQNLSNEGANFKKYWVSLCDIIRLKGPPHVGRSNISVPSIYKEVHDQIGGSDFYILHVVNKNVLHAWNSGCPKIYKLSNLYWNKHFFLWVKPAAF